MKTRWTLLVILLLVLAACGDDGGDEALGTVELPQSDTIDLQEGQLTLNYPAGWVITGVSFDSFVLANSAGIEPGAVASGQFRAVINVIYQNEIFNYGLEPEQSAGDALDAIIDLSEDTGQDIDVDDRDGFQANGRDAVIASGTVRTDTGTTQGFVYVVVAVPDGFVSMIANTAEGEADQFTTTLRAVAASVVFTPPAG